MTDYYALHWSDIFGNMGVLLLVSTYLLLQADKIDAKGFFYSFANLMVALLLFVNLYFKPVLANITLEIFWAAISIYGLYKWNKKRKNK
jgi:nicotinamide riboside transporter PnuC